MKKTIFALAFLVAAVAVGFAIKVGPDPVKMAKVEVGCPIAVNGVAESCDRR